MTRGAGAASPDPSTVAAAARDWLAEGAPALPPGAALHAPLPIHTPTGRLDGWFVPVVAGAHLVAYLRFTAQGVRRGLSSFQRQPGATAGCPLAADWLDEARITARARAAAVSGGNAAAPVLSYDGSPDRLAWRVVFSPIGSAPCCVCVAGTSAWACAAQA